MSRALWLFFFFHNQGAESYANGAAQLNSMLNRFHISLIVKTSFQEVGLVKEWGTQDSHSTQRLILWMFTWTQGIHNWTAPSIAFSRSVGYTHTLISSVNVCSKWRIDHSGYSEKCPSLTVTWRSRVGRLKLVDMGICACRLELLMPRHKKPTVCWRKVQRLNLKLRFKKFKRLLPQPFDSLSSD